MIIERGVYMTSNAWDRNVELLLHNLEWHEVISNTDKECCSILDVNKTSIINININLLIQVEMWSHKSLRTSLTLEYFTASLDRY